MKAWSLLLFCLILFSCNMGQHYARLRIGHNAEPINTGTQALPKAFASIPGPGLIESRYCDSLAETPVVHAVLVKKTSPILHHHPDTLLSSPTKNKPKGYQAHYTREVPHKKHGTNARIISCLLHWPFAWA